MCSTQKSSSSAHSCRVDRFVEISSLIIKKNKIRIYIKFLVLSVYEWKSFSSNKLKTHQWHARETKNERAVECFIINFLKIKSVPEKKIIKFYSVSKHMLLKTHMVFKNRLSRRLLVFAAFLLSTISLLAFINAGSQVTYECEYKNKI